MDDEEWIDGREASKLLTEKYGRPISMETLRNLAYTSKPPKIRTKHAREGDRRVALYHKGDVEQVVLRERRWRRKPADSET